MNRCEFMDVLTEQIRCKRALPLVTKEIEAHIDDQKAEFLAEGMMDAEAEEAAVREMGDPVGTGIMLDRVHRPRMEWSIFGSAVILSLVGLALQIMVLTADTPIGSENWFIGIWNGIEKNILGMAVGVAIMLAVCWIDYSVVGKYAVSL